MTKQEFLAMSIFSNLKYLDDNNKIVELHCVDNGIGLVNFGWGDAKEFTNVKPILRPLSSLTKEIEHKGEKFVPIIELAKINYADISWTGKFTLDQNVVHFDSYKSINYFWYDKEDKCFVVLFSDETVRVKNQFELFQKLIEWNFDLFGGIDNGEAIDVNTLRENPYK